MKSLEYKAKDKIFFEIFENDSVEYKNGEVISQEIIYEDYKEE